MADKPSPKDYRIARSSIQGMDDEEVLWAVIEPMWDDLSLDEEPQRGMTATLTPGQRGLIAIDWLSKEVYNGGVDQFFMNTTGVLAHEALEGFRILGAERYDSLFRAVVALFPGGQVPRDHAARQAARRAIPEEARRQAFEEFDRGFNALMDGEDPIAAHGMRYLEAHPEEFFR